MRPRPEAPANTQSLRDAGEVLRATLSRAPIAIVIIDTSGQVRGGWNDATTRLLGWSVEEVRDRTLSSLLDPRTDAGIPVVVTPEARGGPVPRTAATVSTRAGELVHVEISSALLTNAAGGLSGAVVFIEDRSSLRILEAQLKQAQKLEAVGQLAGGIAHDFNNLLTIVQTNAELLGDQLPDRAALGEHLTDIQEAVTRGSQLIGRLMAFGRNDPMEYGTLDMGPLVSSYANTLGRVLPDNIQVEVTVGADVPQVRADPGALQQIMLNLATNARDAMPDGGKLRLQVVRATHSGAEPRGAVEAPGGALGEPGGALGEPGGALGEPGGDWVRLSVQDSGVGVEPDVLEHIFEPFFTTKSPDKGTGLGLSMVQELTRQLGGSATVRSEPSKGTEFRIFIPAASPATEPEALGGTISASPSGRPPEGTGTILIVEDDISVRKVLRRALLGAGYDVVVTADGEQALEAFRAHPSGVDLVLSDLIMPNMDGASLYQALNDTGSPDVPFLFISGYGDQDPRVEALLAQGIPVLHKPWSVQHLCEAVQDALSESPASKGTDLGSNLR